MEHESVSGKNRCHIHDNVEIFEESEIRQNVCVNDQPFYQHSDEKYYCLFHLPTKTKDHKKFDEIFRLRLNKVKQKLKEINRLADLDQKIAKRQISFDFRFVWFPATVELTAFEFDARVKFKSATFSAQANFKSTLFSAQADFTSANFAASVDFTNSRFYFESNFNSTIFLADVTYHSARFFGETDFQKTVISANAEFYETIFFEALYFNAGKFLETAQVFFEKTEFHRKVDFANAVVAGYIAFAGKQFSRLFLTKHSFIDLQNTRITDPKRISFHAVRLLPSWFINTDASEFSFTDCHWIYTDNSPLKTKIELENLRKSKDFFSNPNALLAKICRQLAHNYEENKGYEEASIFRQMAMESKRTESLWGFKVWSLHWWYWLSSLYGESWQRALGILLIILIFYSIYFQFAFFQICPKNSENKNNCINRTMMLDEAIQQSLYTAAFQNIEYRKTLTSGEDIMILLEKILAPLQAALLALAIRRKFMR